MVHGLGGSPNGGWRPWLMGELAKLDIYAASLSMPDSDHPSLQAWVEEIRRHVEEGPIGPVYLVGHSLGVPAILRYIETSNMKRIGGIVLVSGPSVPTKKKLAAEFLEEPFDFAKILKRTKNCVVIHGSNDPVVSVDQAHFLAESLDTKAVLVKNGGHLNGSAGVTKLPQCLKALNQMFNL